MSDREPSPTLGGVDDVLLHERASATPRTRAPSASAAARANDAASSPVEARFDRLQSWFAASVTHPGELAEGVLADGLITSLGELGRVLTPGPRLGPLERLGVYHHAYRARLVECLRDDYPALAHAIGEQAFEELCHGYIERFPSRSANLNAFGRHMAGHLRDRSLDAGDVTGVPLAFLADLAALEWALVEVLHAAAAPTLSLDALQAVPPEAWTSARLPRAQTVRLLRFSYPVNAYFQDWRVGASPAVPAAAPSATVIYRHELTSWRLDLTPAMSALLAALFAGETLGEALARIEREVDGPEELAEAERSVMIWFREWVAGGVFERIELQGRELARTP